MTKIKSPSEANGLILPMSLHVLPKGIIINKSISTELRNEINNKIYNYSTAQYICRYTNVYIDTSICIILKKHYLSDS